MVPLLIVIFIVLGAVGFYITNGILSIRSKHKQKKQELNNIIENISSMTEELNRLTDEAKQASLNIDILRSALNNTTKDLNQLENVAEEKKKQISEIENNYNSLIDKYQKQKDEADEYEQSVQEDVQEIINGLNKKSTSLQRQISVQEDKIKSYIETQKRQEEVRTAAEFYKIQLTDTDIEDVRKLDNLSKELHNKDVLLKLIYKTYYEQKLNDLLGRVIGADSTVSGIYRITNTISGMAYIGQCVNFKDRWRTHVKRGIGIETPTSNKLYDAMKKDGLWNFTFEVLEKCGKPQLNEKEKYWIEIYQTNTYGYNMKAGG